MYYTVLSSLHGQFFENNFCPIEEVHRKGNDLNSKSISDCMQTELFLFSVEALQFSRFHENESKHNQLNFNRGLTVRFKVKNS